VSITFVFDYSNTTIFIPEKKLSPQMQEFLEYLKKIDETMKTGCFNSSSLTEDLGNLGLRLQENSNSATSKDITCNNVHMDILSICAMHVWLLNNQAHNIFVCLAATNFVINLSLNFFHVHPYTSSQD
jgi:hypothetical protein